MKSIYFAGKFALSPDTSLSVEERLSGDYRSKILGNSGRFTYASQDCYLPCGYRYAGAFYCEKASDGEYKSEACDTVLTSEFLAVKNNDIFFAVLDDTFSAGTVVEIEWAIQYEKPMVIFYRADSSREGELKSEYWFAIADALKRGKRTIVKAFTEYGEIVSAVLDGKIFEELYKP